MATDAEKDRLASLDTEIAALRDARKPRRSAGADKFNAASLAWRMVTELVVGVLLGAAIGWGLDSVAGTLPLFLIIFTLLGFAAGVRVLIRSGAEVSRRGLGGGDAQDGSGAGGTQRDTATGGDRTRG